MTYWIPMTDDDWDWVNTGTVPEKQSSETLDEYYRNA